MTTYLRSVFKSMALCPLHDAGSSTSCFVYSQYSACVLRHCASTATATASSSEFFFACPFEDMVLVRTAIVRQFK